MGPEPDSEPELPKLSNSQKSESGAGSRPGTGSSLIDTISRPARRWLLGLHARRGHTRLHRRRQPAQLRADLLERTAGQDDLRSEGVQLCPKGCLGDPGKVS